MTTTTLDRTFSRELPTFGTAEARPEYDYPMTPRRRELLEGDGFFVVRGVLDGEDIRLVKERLTRICENIDYYRQHIGIIKTADEDASDPLYRFNWINEIGFRDEVLWRHATAHPRLVEVACDVIGPNVYPMNGGGFFFKPPGGARVPWHQDASPFQIKDEHGETHNPLLFDFWLGVDAGTRANGCLQLVPGSQKLGRVEHHASGGLLSELRPHDHGFSDSDIVFVETDPGDLIVWHQEMFHGSDPNRSQGGRVAKASVYMGGREEQTLRSWFSTGQPTPAVHKHRTPIALDGQPYQLDMPLPLPDGS